MKRDFAKTMTTGLLAGSVMFLTVMSSSVNAAQETYTVTYRPGNVGAFAVSGTRETDKKAMAEEVAELLYGDNADVKDIQITEKGAIKLSVVREAAIPEAPGAGYVQAQSGYFVRNVSEWGPGEDEKVIRNVDFVVDYGRLVNGVEYSISYVDAVSGLSVAPVTIAYGNIGDTVSASAPTERILSGVAKYNLEGTASQTMVLSENSGENVLEFRYRAEASGTEEKVNVEYEEGDTVVITRTVQLPSQSKRGVGAVLAQGQRQEDNKTAAEPAQRETEAAAEPAQGETETAAEPAQRETETASEPEEQAQGETETASEPEQTKDNTASDEVTNMEETEQTLGENTSNGEIRKMSRIRKGIYLGATLAAALLLAVGTVWFRYTRSRKMGEIENEGN